jgi:hypothetical protein
MTHPFGGVRAASLAVIGLVLTAAPTVSNAQDVPAGDYERTCGGIAVVDGVLEATCRRADGTIATSTLRHPNRCAYGVSNENGNLVCTPAPAPDQTNAPSRGHSTP